MQTLHNDPRIFNSSKDNTDTSGSVASFSLESDPIRVPSQATNITIESSQQPSGITSRIL